MTPSSPPSSTADRILAAAEDIIERDGPEGLTTRAVCLAAGVTAPTLYHHFGDKTGLLAAVVRRGVAAFLAGKRANAVTDDPVADLVRGWSGWIDFALARPRLFRLLVAASLEDPGTAGEAFAIMAAHVDRIARAGRLAVPPDDAALAVWAASNGVLGLLDQERSPGTVRATAQILIDALLARLVVPGPSP